MNEQLKKLYQSVILKNNKEPFQFVKRESAEYVLQAYNQICGDRFKLYFEIENNRISQLNFHGFGCAISKSSTSILVQNLEGKTIEDAQEIVNSFLSVVDNEGETQDIIKDDFKAFSAAKSFPGRRNCATLSWDEINKFLKK